MDKAFQNLFFFDFHFNHEHSVTILLCNKINGTINESHNNMHGADGV
ncbi:hypothetical protein D1BOALGB6SA_10622 [Olavius sp. associated proteobacterium Delta 1]|nr:hypothetical protein D1BOALGB6SA_10622 [Olavius sp. associated proteobacterium Delta 1]